MLCVVRKSLFMFSRVKNKLVMKIKVEKCQKCFPQFKHILNTLVNEEDTDASSALCKFPVL